MPLQQTLVVRCCGDDGDSPALRAALVSKLSSRHKPSYLPLLRNLWCTPDHAHMRVSICDDNIVRTFTSIPGTCSITMSRRIFPLSVVRNAIGRHRLHVPANCRCRTIFAASLDPAKGGQSSGCSLKFSTFDLNLHLTHYLYS